jgi:hypothetical protein
VLLCGGTRHTHKDNMARASDWASKVLAILKSGNTDAAIAQIKVAPTVKDITALQGLMVAGNLKGRWRDVDAAIGENKAALAAPRLHRSP